MKVKDEAKGSEMVKKEEGKDRLEESLYEEELIEPVSKCTKGTTRLDNWFKIQFKGKKTRHKCQTCN